MNDQREQVNPPGRKANGDYRGSLGLRWSQGRADYQAERLCLVHAALDAIDITPPEEGRRICECMIKIMRTSKRLRNRLAACECLFAWRDCLPEGFDPQEITRFLCDTVTDEASPPREKLRAFNQILAIKKATLDELVTRVKEIAAAVGG